MHADIVIENSYSFPMVTHFAIEPHGFMAAVDADGIRIWSPVQHPFLLQKIVAELFDQPLTRVRVFAPDPGGGFGGKQNPKYEPLLIYLALRTGRPCRLVLTLEETFQTVRRAAAEISVRFRLQSLWRFAFSGHQIGFSNWSLCRHRGTGDDQKQLSGMRPIQDAKCQSPRSRRAFAHHA